MIDVTSNCISGGGKEVVSKILETLDMLAKDPKEKAILKRLKTDLKTMPICPVVTPRGAKKPRKPSRWQLCIKEEREGKPFDPQAMKKLSPKYKAGLCPTKAFLEKHDA